MFYLVCYDIADDGRRGRVVKVLLDYGSRIQESVFAAHLDADLFERMRARLEKAINPTEDRVHLARLCKACEAELLPLGLAEVRRDADYWVI